MNRRLMRGMMSLSRKFHELDGALRLRRGHRVLSAIVAFACLLPIARAQSQSQAQGQDQSQPQTQSQTQAQNPDVNPNWQYTNVLDRGNMSRVAASAEDIEAVLQLDTGLLVELKRLAAKEATDHGQVVIDLDLTDDGIYQRLHNDVEFRSLATDLLQRYGYLVPQINPNSAMGKEQDLLIQERSKWLAQSQEEERSRQRQKDLQAMNQACDPIQDPTCALQRQRNQPGAAQNTAGAIPGQNAPNSAYPPGSAPQYSTFGSRMQQAGAMGAGGASQGFLNQSLAGAQLNGGMGGTGNVSQGGNYNPFMGSQFPGGQQQQGGQNPNQFGAPATGNNPLGGMPSQQNGQFPGGGLGGLNSAMGGLGGAGNASMMPSEANTGFFPTNPSNPFYLLSGAPIAPEEPRMVRRPDPYAQVPSIYDMYLQAIPHPTKPMRFGMDLFENGIRDPQLLPMDLPVGPDYVVGPGDTLSINIWGGASQVVFGVVDGQGRVSLPEVGPVEVSGRTLGEVQVSLQKLLRTQLHGVSVDVSLARLRSVRVYVVGDVEHPGAYDISSLSTPLNALFAAGGPTRGGSLRLLKHYRGTQLVQTVDMYDLLLHGVRSDVMHLESGDTVLVSPMGPEVTVEGMVRRPAIYELKDEKSLADILALAGGMLPTAALRHIEVQRLEAHERRTMLSLDIPESDTGDAVTKQTRGVPGPGSRRCAAISDRAF